MSYKDAGFLRLYLATQAKGLQGYISNHVLIAIKLAVKFTTFYSEMHGHVHKILKRSKQNKIRITNFEHSIKMQYFLALALFPLINRSIHEAKHLIIPQIASADFCFITVTKKCFMTL